MWETLLHYCSTQLKVLTNVFCLKYCTEVIYVYMYSFMNVFLNPYTRSECNFFVILFAIPSLWRLSRDLACTGSGIPYFYCTVYCMSYSLCVHLKEQLCGWNKHELCLAKCIFIYLNRHDGCQTQRIAVPLPLHRLNYRFICQADGILLILYFELENVCSMVTLMIFLYLIFMMVWLWW